MKGTRVGIFSKKPTISVCDMCGKSDTEGCGSARNHVEQISADHPAWLPARLRAQAPGEYTWLCTRCNSYPDMKWPHPHGAWSGLTIHLDAAHNVGEYRGIGRIGKVPMIPMS